MSEYIDFYDLGISYQGKFQPENKVKKHFDLHKGELRVSGAIHHGSVLEFEKDQAALLVKYLQEKYNV